MTTRVHSLNRNLITKMLITAIGFLFLFAYLYPIYILLTVAVKTPSELAASALAFPKGIALRNFTEAIKQSEFFLLLGNSLVLTLITVFFLIVLSSMASYVIERSSKRFPKFLYYFFISGLMVPIQMIMLPLYKLISTVGLMNSLFALVVVYLGSGMPFLVFYFVGFLKTIPRELDEAALIDGASRQRTYWSVIFPLMKTSVMTVAVLQVIWVWNDFLLPLLFLNSYKKMTLMVGIYSFVGEHTSDWTMMFALIVISILPVILLYVLLQKYIVEGFVSGAIKG